MSTELSIRPDQTAFDDTQTAALQALGIDKAPKGDQQLFMHVAQRSGLDPFAKQIYLIPRWDGKENKQKWTIQTSIDGLRVLRDRIGTYRGHTTEWCGPDGVWKDVWLSDKPPAAARVLVYVAGREVPAKGIALWREYVQTNKNGAVTSMWASKATVMIAKCAEAIAYRQAFPQDFSGLYVAEEMPAVEQDHDGPNVNTLMRSDLDQNRGINKGSGHSKETEVIARSDRENTAQTRPRRGPSRPESVPAAGRADQPRTILAPVDTEAIADEWATRSGRTTTVQDARDLYTEARTRHLLDYTTSGGETLRDVLAARGQQLKVEAEQDAEETPGILAGAIEIDDSVEAPY